MIRNPEALDTVMRARFTGYADHTGRLIPLATRITACVAILAGMVIPGIILGTPRE